MKKSVSLFVLSLFVFSLGFVVSEELKLYLGDEYNVTNLISFEIYEIKEDSVDVKVYFGEEEQDIFTLLGYRETFMGGKYFNIIDKDLDEGYVILDIFDSEERQRRINERLNQTEINKTTPQPPIDRNVSEQNDTEEDFDCGTLSRQRCNAETMCAWNEARNRCLGKGTQKVQNRTPERMHNNTRINPARQRVLNYLNATECPEECRCVGAVIKCNINGTREMTVIAGVSGNIIIQTKGMNATTKMELIRENNETYMNVSGQMKQMRVMPDEAFEKVKKRIRISECNSENNCSVDLDENGKYEIQLERHSRILGVFSKKMNIRAEVDAESGDLIVKKPWWAFIASEPKE